MGWVPTDEEYEQSKKGIRSLFEDNPYEFCIMNYCFDPDSIVYKVRKWAKHNAEVLKNPGGMEYYKWLEEFLDEHSLMTGIDGSLYYANALKVVGEKKLPAKAKEVKVVKGALKIEPSLFD